MKSGHIAAAALFSAGIVLACPVPALAQEGSATAAAVSVPDAPYTRWLYGLDGSRTSGAPDGLVADPGARYGSPPSGVAYDQEISVGPDTRAVTVAQNETVKFVMPDGREFLWTFDTPRTVVPLARIAPFGTPLASNVAVFVTNDGSSGRG